MSAGYIVVYTGTNRLRYISVPAFKVFRGMYRSRRVVRVDRAEWTDDRELACVFPAKATAERQIRLVGAGPNPKTLHVERVARKNLV